MLVMDTFKLIKLERQAEETLNKNQDQSLRFVTVIEKSRNAEAGPSLIKKCL